MAQWDSANNILRSQTKTLFEVNIPNTQSILAGDFNLQVARGKVNGVSLVNLYGYQAAVDDTFIPIWENPTTYTYPLNGGEQMTLYSSSASDTNVTVFIDGLDLNFLPINESLLLTNGTTGVTTVNSYRRINSMRITGSVNPVGIIRLANSGKTTTYAQIAIGTGRTQWSIYTVPAGYTFFLNRVTAAASATNSDKVLRYRVYQISGTGLQSLVLQSPWIDTYETLRVIPNPYLEKTSIQWQVTSDTISQVGLRVEGILIRNDLL
jgi:hypothetical protein